MPTISRALRGFYVDFWTWPASFTSMLLELALLTKRSACQRPYGAIIDRLTQRKRRCAPHSRHQAPPQRASVAWRCPQSLGHLAEMRQKLTCPPNADSFAVGNRPMTSI